MKKNRYLRRLADKIYRSRPVRNCMIIATIALMTCLIMSMAGVMEAADYLTRQENMRNFGTTAQGIYTGLTREQYEALKQMADITEIAGEAYLGVAAENMGNTQVFVYYASQECAAENFHGLTAGKCVSDGYLPVPDFYVPGCAVFRTTEIRGGNGKTVPADSYAAIRKTRTLGDYHRAFAGSGL